MEEQRECFICKTLTTKYDTELLDIPYLCICNDVVCLKKWKENKKHWINEINKKMKVYRDYAISGVKKYNKSFEILKKVHIEINKIIKVSDLIIKLPKDIKYLYGNITRLSDFKNRENKRIKNILSVNNIKLLDIDDEVLIELMKKYIESKIIQ